MDHAEHIDRQVNDEANKRVADVIKKTLLLRERARSDDWYDGVRKVIYLQNGKEARLGGFYVYETKCPGRRYGNSTIITHKMAIYHTDEDIEVKSHNPNIVCLLPTKDWNHYLGERQFQKFHMDGKYIVLSKDTWSTIKQADEIEVIE